MPDLWFIAPDDNTPTGGIRMIYRQVDVLNGLGFPASVLHAEPGFRADWFANETRATSSKQMRARPGDLVVVPEVYGPDLASFARGIRKVIFNQNAYMSFEQYPQDGSADRTAYLDSELAAVIVVSEDNRRYLGHLFPDLNVHRVLHAIPPELYSFVPRERKRPLVAYMPRKHADEAREVFNALRFKGALDGFDVVAIEDVTAEEAARLLGEATLFFAFGYPEGFSLPPAEAMARGCVVVGYHGFAGREYFTSDVGFPIEPADIQGFVRVAESVLPRCRAGDPALRQLAERASRTVLETYTPEAERKSVRDAWTAILGKR